MSFNLSGPNFPYTNFSASLWKHAKGKTKPTEETKEEGNIAGSRAIVVSKKDTVPTSWVLYPSREIFPINEPL